MARKTKKKVSAFRGKVKKDVKRQESKNSGFGYLVVPKDVKFYSPTPGSREKIDIIPYTIKDKTHPDVDPETGLNVGDEWYKRPFKLHKNVGAENISLICPTSIGKKCPICEYKKKRAKEGASKDELDGYKTTNRNLYLVIPRDVKKTPEEIHIWDMSDYLFQKPLNEEINEDEDYEIFPDTEQGYTLKVRWNEKSLKGHKYAEAGRIDFIERDGAIDESEIEDIPCLDDCIKILSYYQINAKFMEDEVEGTEDEDEDEDEYNDADTTSKRKVKKSESPFKEDDDDNDDDDDDGEVLTWSELKDMDENELYDVAEANELDIDGEESEDELRKLIAEELEIEIPKEKKKAPTKKKSEPIKKTSTKKKKEKKKEDECPDGHEFGVDVDVHDECEECPLWDKCMDKNDELEAE